jgi:hypothetical protein
VRYNRHSKSDLLALGPALATLSHMTLSLVRLSLGEFAVDISCKLP